MSQPVTLTSLGCVPAPNDYVTGPHDVDQARANTAALLAFRDQYDSSDVNRAEALILERGVWELAFPPNAQPGDYLLPLTGLNGLEIRAGAGSGSTWQGAGLHGTWFVLLPDGAPPNACGLDLSNDYKMRLSGLSIYGSLLPDPGVGVRMRGTLGDNSDLTLVEGLNVTGEWAQSLCMIDCGNTIVGVSDLWSQSDAVGRQVGTTALSMTRCSGVEVDWSLAFASTSQPATVDAITLDGCSDVVIRGGHFGGSRAAIRCQGTPSHGIDLSHCLLGGIYGIFLDAPGEYTGWEIHRVRAPQPDIFILGAPDTRIRGWNVDNIARPWATGTFLSLGPVDPSVVSQIQDSDLSVEAGAIYVQSAQIDDSNLIRYAPYVYGPPGFQNRSRSKRGGL